MQLELPHLHKELKKRSDLANCTDFLGLLAKELQKSKKKNAMNFCFIYNYEHTFSSMKVNNTYKSMDDG
jgi:hypothetical protein